jgi:hypothetical protein
MEYTDSTIKIYVKTLPVYLKKKSIIKILNVNTLSGLKDIDFIDFIKLIEIALCEIIDAKFKSALSTCVYDYYICGGKSINNIISNKYLTKSFDFDIHVKNEEDIQKISEHIVSDISRDINKHYHLHLRKQIFFKLLNIKAVENTPEFIDYYMHEDLFFYGVRKRTLSINSIFIKLKISNQFIYIDQAGIRTPIIYTNYSTYGDGTYNDLQNNGTIKHNIIYIPVADIDTDDFNMGIAAYKSLNSFYTPKFNKSLIYINYMITLYNLLGLYNLNVKPESNLIKYNQFTRPLYYNCNFIKECDLNYFTQMAANIINQFKPIGNNIIRRNKGIYNIPFLKKDIEYYDIFNSIINNVLRYRQSKLPCIVAVGPTTTRTENFILPGGNRVQILTNLERIVCTHDSANNNYILSYTLTLSKQLNVYCSYISNFINPAVVGDSNRDLSTKTILFQDNTEQEIHLTQLNLTHANYGDVCQSMDNVFNSVHNDPLFNQELINLNDEFIVYSLQELLSFCQIDRILGRSYIDTSLIKKGDIIEISPYISTTLNPQTQLGEFYKKNSTLFKIKINKNIKRWLLLNNYSYIPDESEVIIQRGSIFIIENIEYSMIDITRYDETGEVEIKIITLILTDNDSQSFLTQDIIDKTLLVSGMEKYDNVLESNLFLKTINYVYDTHLRHPYKDAILCPTHLNVGGTATSIDFDVYYDNTVERRTIHRNNHGLAHTIRVACWIQLLCLAKEKYFTDNDIHYQFASNHLFILKTCIASTFMISGRESEVGVGISATRDQCPNVDFGTDGSLYLKYKRASADNFKTYMLKIQRLNLFTQAEIDSYVKCLIFYEKIIKDSTYASTCTNMEKFVAKLFALGHSYDLLRVFPDYRTSLLLSKTHESYQYEKKIYKNLLHKMLFNTGDIIIANKIVFNGEHHETVTPRVSYDTRQFYLCSINPEYCITQVLNTTKEYFNELVYDIKLKALNIPIVNDFNFKTITTDPTIITIIDDDIAKEPTKELRELKQEVQCELIKVIKNEELDIILIEHIINKYMYKNKQNTDFYDSLKEYLNKAKKIYNKKDQLVQDKKVITIDNISDNEKQVITSNNTSDEDDNVDVDINSLNNYINNMNLGSTFYLSNYSYKSQIKNSLSYRINSIYLQNIIIIINTSNPCNDNDNYNYHYLLKNNILTKEENEIYNIIYPQYYILKVTNKNTNSTSSDDYYHTSSDDYYQQKYLKYKQKYINYKQKYINYKK